MTLRNWSRGASWISLTHTRCTGLFQREPKKGAKQLTLDDTQMAMGHPYPMTAPYGSLPAQQVHNYMMPPHDRSWRDYAPDQSHPEIPYQCPVTFGPRGHHWQGPSCENGCQVTGTFYACAPPESQAPGIPIEPSIRSAEALALSGECGASCKAPREGASLLY